MSRKNPRRERAPKGRKKATSVRSPSTQNKQLVWKVSKIDDKGQWGWNNISCPDFLRNIWDKMRNFETMTWSQILGRSHHMIPVSDIIKPAQERLRELKHDDQEELVSLRLTGKQRLWAIRSGGEAFLLWWDPNHEICPSPKKHT
ncbi:MAG: hypothetical protein OXI43_21255 [Candidatus Poribacteria bacterium]|nr:hypothetical protein [Candidatus Poribacteria bacterium]